MKFQPRLSEAPPVQEAGEARETMPSPGWARTLASYAKKTGKPALLLLALNCSQEACVRRTSIGPSQDMRSILEHPEAWMNERPAKDIPKTYAEMVKALEQMVEVPGEDGKYHPHEGPTRIAELVDKQSRRHEAGMRRPENKEASVSGFEAYGIQNGHFQDYLRTSLPGSWMRGGSVGEVRLAPEVKPMNYPGELQGKPEAAHCACPLNGGPCSIVMTDVRYTNSAPEDTYQELLVSNTLHEGAHANAFDTSPYLTKAQVIELTYRSVKLASSSGRCKFYESHGIRITDENNILDRATEYYAEAMEVVLGGVYDDAVDFPTWHDAVVRDFRTAYGATKEGAEETFELCIRMLQSTDPGFLASKPWEIARLRLQGARKLAVEAQETRAVRSIADTKDPRLAAFASAFERVSLREAPEDARRFLIDTLWRKRPSDLVEAYDDITVKICDSFGGATTDTCELGVEAVRALARIKYAKETSAPEIARGAVLIVKRFSDAYVRLSSEDQGRILKTVHRAQEILLARATMKPAKPEDE